MASKSRPPRKKVAPNKLSELGLFDIPNLDLEDNSDDQSDMDESTLESELEALMRGEAPLKRSKPKPKAPQLDIEKLAADCLKDDDDDDEEDDGDLSGNEELLKELQKLSPEMTDQDEISAIVPEIASTDAPSPAEDTSGSLLDLLHQRLNVYNEAVKAAKLSNDTSKVRRYGRAVKSLENLLKSAKSGAVINEDDIPPMVSIPKVSTSTAPQPLPRPAVKIPENITDNSQPETLQSSKVQQVSSLTALEKPSNVSSTSSLLTTRQNQYKVAALQAKKSGNKELAIKYMRTAKTFDAVIEAANNNQPVDLTNIPPLPPGFPDVNPQTAQMDSQKRAHEQIQQASAMEIAALAAANEDEQPEIFAAPPAPSTVLEALQQRLEKYLQTKEAAESEGNSGKVRRLQRIVKSYETAIKDFKSGKTVDFEELPTPPGFAPIPVGGGNTNTNPTMKETPGKPKAPAPSSTVQKPAAISNVPAVPQRKPKVQRANTSTGEKQLDFLLERQKLFRQAALSAKQNGDIIQAKEYLRMAKGFDSMIEATKCGLPIDASTIPTPPQLETDFEIVEVSECLENSDLSQEELYENLEKDLCNQLDICSRNKEHFMRLGDVVSASKFEKLALETAKDRSVIQHLKRKGESAPKFHYETRLFSMVLCNPELSDNELDVSVERGINLPGKQDELDSYVRVEFPIPTESPQRAKTHTIYNTNNPVFEESFKFEINRKARAQLRLFKRHSLKLEVWSKGGFLRSDKLLGTVNVKLCDLESKCTVHDSYNLMDNRKACGGKLEVKMRLRDPLLIKQVEEVREKWLVIGS